MQIQLRILVNVEIRTFIDFREFDRGEQSKEERARKSEGQGRGQVDQRQDLNNMIKLKNEQKKI